MWMKTMAGTTNILVLLALHSLCIIDLGIVSWAFVLKPGVVKQRSQATSPCAAADNDKDGGSSGWLESLRARQQYLDLKEEEQSNRWRKAECSSGVAAILPDWVRRVAVSYPLAACGSASGSIYVVHLQRPGEVIATNAVTEGDPDALQMTENGPANLPGTLRRLYGSFDGGGTIAVAILGNMICDAGRSGGVNVWGLDAKAGKLVSQGSIPALCGCLVTCLHLDEDYLWVATADGNVQNFPLDNPDLPLALQTEPEYTWSVNSPILSMCIDSDIGCGVVTTASGSIELISLEDDETERSAGSFMPPFDATERRASNAYAMCCTLVRHRAGNKTLEELPCSIVCGGNDGSMYSQPLAFDDEGQVDFDHPFRKSMEQLSPRHMAAVKCLASPAPGMLISGGQDSAMRVWDIDKAKLLYQFSGYKVWLGSLWTDGVRVISDGADNTLIMHDFSHNEEQKTSENPD